MLYIRLYFEYQISDLWQIKAAVQIFETNSFIDFITFSISRTTRFTINCAVEYTGESLILS